MTSCLFQFPAKATKTGHLRHRPHQTDLHAAARVFQGDSGAATVLWRQEKSNAKTPDENYSDLQQGRLCLSQTTAEVTQRLKVHTAGFMKIYFRNVWWLMYLLRTCTHSPWFLIVFLCLKHNSIALHLGLIALYSIWSSKILHIGPLKIVWRGKWENWEVQSNLILLFSVIKPTKCWTIPLMKLEI